MTTRSQRGGPARLIHGSVPDLRAVLFDLDGTLVQTHIDFPGMRRSVLELAQRWGAEVEAVAGRDALTILAAARDQVADRERFDAEAEDLLVELELAGCEGAMPMAGAGEVLEWLASVGMRVGIVTRNSPQAVARILREFSLPHEVLLTRADTPHVKPHPEHLWRALRHLETPPDASLMVGDHTMDVEGGKAAGTWTAGLLTPGKPADFFDSAEPDLVLHRLPELRDWISR